MGNEHENLAEFIDDLVLRQTKKTEQIAQQIDSESVLPFIDATCKGELAIAAFEKFIDALVEFRSWYILNPEAARILRPQFYQLLLDARSEISTTIGTVARYLPTTRSE